MVSSPSQVVSLADLGVALSRLRQDRGLTVRAVARAAGIPHSTVGGYFAGRHLPPPTRPQDFAKVLTVLGVPASEHEAWFDAVRRLERRRTRASAARVPGPAADPYLGLAAFGPQDASVFFGRGELAARLLETVLTADGLVAVVGASGAGKSSLLGAGLVPLLVAGDRPYAVVQRFVPGSDPLAALRGAVAEMSARVADPAAGLARPLELSAVAPFVEPPDEPSAEPPAEPSAEPPAEPLVEPSADPSGSRKSKGSKRTILRVLIVDQLEQLWHRGVSQQVREEFLETVASLSRAEDQRVVVALRSDFFAPAAEEPVLANALAHRQFLVEPLDARGLREAIVAPAATTGLVVEPALVEELMRDAGLGVGDAGLGVGRDGCDAAGPESRSSQRVPHMVLPHLSHALAQMWHQSTSRVLTLADYAAVGRLEGAIVRTAEAAWAHVAPDDREAVRALLLALVTVEEDMPATARRLPLPTLGDQDGGKSAAYGLLDPFVARRLVSIEEDHIRFAHEVILVTWPRLAGWIEADRERLVTARVVAREAREWEAADRDPALVLRGGRLAAAQEWAGAPHQHVTETERDFLAAGRAEADRGIRQERANHRRTRGFLVAVSVLAVVALTASGALMWARVQISTERDQAQSRQLAAQSLSYAASDPALAAHLALRAEQIADTRQARSAVVSAAGSPLVSTIPGPVGPRMVAVAPTRNLLVAVGTSATANLYDIGGPAPREVAQFPAPTSAAGDAVFAVAFAPDGRRVAMAGTAGLVRVVDVTDPKHPRALGADQPISAGGGL